jgi:hypothetical protein
MILNHIGNMAMTGMDIMLNIHNMNTKNDKVKLNVISTNADGNLNIPQSDTILG